MRYYIYTRCSTEEQRKQGNSHEYQRQGIESNPRLNNSQLLEVFSDTITGTTFDRPQLDKMYNYCDIHRGHVDHIYVYRWDRFGRDVGEAFQMIKKFAAVGVVVNCLDSSIDYQDDNWPTILAVIFGMAQSESLKISSRTKDGMYQSNLQGFYTKQLPIGYKRIDSTIKKKDGKRRRIVVIDDNYADIVRLLFKEYISGVSKSSLYALYHDKLPCSRSSFYRIFSSFIYTGYISLPPYKHYPARVVKAKHESIISMSTWNAAEAIGHRSTKGMKYNVKDNGLYLKGIIRNEHELYTSYYSKGKSGQRYGYYDIRGKKGMILSSTKCHDTIDHLMEALTIDITSDHYSVIADIFRSLTNDIQDEIAEAKKNLTNCINRMRKLEDDYFDGHLEARSYNSSFNSLDIQKVELQKQLIDLDHKSRHQAQMIDKCANTIKNIGKIFIESNNDGRLQILQAVFPSGFDIKKPDYTVRTPEINNVVSLLCSNTAFYDQLENKNGTPFLRHPVKGETLHTFRTHYTLIANIKSA